MAVAEADMITADDFDRLVGSDEVVLIVRCGGGNGRCGRIRAVILADGRVRHAPKNCHRFDTYFYERRDVLDAFQEAAARHEQARRGRRRYAPASITVRPLVRRLRADRQLQAEREWRMFEHSEGDGLDEAGG